MFWNFPDHPLTANLFTDALAISFTVLIIDKFLQLAEDNRLKPARQAAFHDSIRVYERAGTLWLKLLLIAIQKSHCHESEIEKSQDFYSDSLGKLVASVDLSADAGFSLPQSLSEHLKREVPAIRNQINEIIDHFALFLRPDLIDSLSALKNCLLFQSALQLEAFERYNREKETGLPSKLFLAHEGAIFVFAGPFQALSETLKEDRRLLGYTPDKCPIIKRESAFHSRVKDAIERQKHLTQ